MRISEKEERRGRTDTSGSAAFGGNDGAISQQADREKGSQK
jgi:hypothetical protein